MTQPVSGLLLAGIHLAMVLSIGGKYAIDRATLPRAWVKTAPFDPELPIRGRYVRLAVEAILDAEITEDQLNYRPLLLSVRDGKLLATPVTTGIYTGVYSRTGRDTAVLLRDSIAFFLPEHVSDPSHREPGEELWAEVSVPKRGPPRPIRLGVKKNNVIAPLNLN